MKRILSILFVFFAVVMTAVAQQRFTVDKETYNFGQIQWKKPATVQYTITNTGNQPLRLTNVAPSCACSVAQWTQTPIAAGGQGNITVEFDAKALGHFDKSIAVYTDTQSKPLYLHFIGEVVTQVKDFSRAYPYLMGEVRLDKNELEFPDSYRGEQPTLRIGVANLSARDYEPILMHLPSYLTMQSEPAVLKQSEHGVITLTLHTDKLKDLGWTESSVYLSRFMGDKVSDENEIPLSIVLLPNLSNVDVANAPAIQLSETEINLSAEPSNKKKVKYDIKLSNVGRSPLRIGKLQVFHSAVGVRLKKNVIKPGDEVHLRITIDRSKLNKKRHLRILLITNDPKQPKAIIHIN
ncbi:MAG: DUF1573 domain-containing protein [Prevotellaceae bacterium]|jgi:hypothetical protein|nr:DUF1573 domain-containing protein [Prevotellaceae bacterium]